MLTSHSLTHGDDLFFMYQRVCRPQGALALAPAGDSGLEDRTDSNTFLPRCVVVRSSVCDRFDGRGRLQLYVSPLAIDFSFCGMLCVGMQLLLQMLLLPLIIVVLYRLIGACISSPPTHMA